jgi:HIP---CoA ligase
MPFFSDSTIPASVLRTIDDRPDALAVVEGDRRVTYRELGDLVIEATRGMIAAGVGRGDRVAVWATNGLGWIVAALGAQSAGAALVPVNTRWKGSEAAHLLAASGAKVLCTSIGFLGTDTVAMLDADETTLARLERIVLLPGSDTPGRSSGESGATVEGWDDFIASGRTVAVDDARARLESIRPDDVSDILFTSGTTGRPKGVVMTHGQTVRQFTEWCDFAGLEQDDRYLIVNPFFHMFGYKAGWLAVFLRGATAYPVAMFDVDTVLSIIERHGITVFPGAPTIYRSILDHPNLDDYDISSLRVAVTGAADIPVSLIEEMRERLPFTSVLTGYGLTEAGTVTGSHPDDDATTVATTAGRAMRDLDVMIANGDGDEVPRGDTGELLVRGYSVMHEYLDDPAATAEAIDSRGFLHTGDLATMDERGYVRIVGRLKDMIIVGGFNVYPAEVENMMLQHPDIGQVSVIGVPDERMGEVAMAWVVPHAGCSLDQDAVIAWCREHMANYKVPRRVALIEALPLNAAGKVVKDDLRALAREAQP